MKRSENEENGEVKRAMVKQEALSYGYDSSYMNYSTAAAISSTNNQPLPGQPPLPPMPPPPGAVPPPPHIFGAVHSQITPIQTWAHPSSPWQWMAQPTSSLPTPSPRDIAVSNYQREIPLRGNYIRSDRFSHSRNHVYAQRGNFHRNKNRRHSRFDQATGQFDQAAYFGAAVPGGISLDWQRGGFSASTAVILPSQHMKPAPTGVATITRHGGESGDRDVQIKSEDVVVKKNKQRKPMSQSYPSRPWNREDAEKALQIENEFNKTIKAHSLIIKFPDPDLSKDIVREFHPGIQNIHFQSPSGPRYCFVQMAENVQIDEAIKELERIPFGVGHLKVERKSLRDEDNPMPEEIDPYTLYIGNLPESVNVNEVKNKFPSAARVDVGYAQKMRNTRYAFIRYNSVDESISAYKKAHDLMWDTRSIIVRFRRQRGNTCLPGEPKANVKKVKEEIAAGQVKKEQQANCDQQSQSKQDNNVQNHKRLQATNNVQNKAVCPTRQQNNGLAPTSQSSETLPTSVAPAKTTQQQQQQPWTSQPPQIPSASEAPPPLPIENDQVTEMVLLAEIKEEPKDYEEMDEHIQTEDEVDDDDDEEEEDDFDDDDEDDDDDNEDDDDDDDDEEEDLDENKMLVADDKFEESNNDAEPMDHLDKMFNELENTTGDIGL